MQGITSERVLDDQLQVGEWEEAQLLPLQVQLQARRRRDLPEEADQEEVGVRQAKQDGLHIAVQVGSGLEAQLLSHHEEQVKVEVYCPHIIRTCQVRNLKHIRNRSAHDVATSIFTFLVFVGLNGVWRFTLTFRTCWASQIFTSIVFCQRLQLSQ